MKRTFTIMIAMAALLTGQSATSPGGSPGRSRGFVKHVARDADGRVEDAGAVLDKHKGGRGEFRVSVKSPRGDAGAEGVPDAGTEAGKFQPVLEADFVVEHGAAAARGVSPFGVETELAAREKRVLIVNVRGGK